MEQLLLVNPAKRPRKRTTRTAAQKRATAKLVAMNKARRRSSYRKNPVPALAAPTYTKTRRKTRRAVTAAVSRARRTRRRNPIGGMGGIGAMLGAALNGTAGALVVNAAYNYLPLPATMRTGYTSYAVKAALAFGLGIFGRRFMGSRAVKMAEGSLIVTMSQLAIQASQGTGLKLGYYSPAVQYRAPAGMRQLAEYLPENGYKMPSLQENYAGMGEYVS